jgi:hypothetical protein
MSEFCLKLIVALLAVQSLVEAIETPSYDVVRQIDSQTEIRKYPATKWVSTSVRDACVKMGNYRNSMFMNLFGYISGQNNKNQKIEMTAPVLTHLKNLNNGLIDATSQCEMTMGFYLPKVDQINTPLPTNSQVFLKDEPEMTVAVIQFGWYPSMDDYLSNRDTLISKLGSEANAYDTADMMIAGEFQFYYSFNCFICY